MTEGLDEDKLADFDFGDRSASLLVLNIVRAGTAESFMTRLSL